MQTYTKLYFLYESSQFGGEINEEKKKVKGQCDYYVFHCKPNWDQILAAFGNRHEERKLFGCLLS